MAKMIEIVDGSKSLEVATSGKKTRVEMTFGPGGMESLKTVGKVSIQVSDEAKTNIPKPKIKMPKSAGIASLSEILGRSSCGGGCGDDIGDFFRRM